MLVALWLLAGRAARADSAGFSLGVEAGVMEFDDHASLGSAGMAWGIRGGMGLIGPTRLEARYLAASHDLAGGSIDVREGTAQLRLSIIPHLRTTPYAFGGIGVRVAERAMPGNRTSDSTLLVPVGAGMDLPLCDFLILAPEFTWHHLLGDAPSAQAPDDPGKDSWNVSLVLRLDV
jgi:hypothetical protein